jgi:hypothetical protein
VRYLFLSFLFSFLFFSLFSRFAHTIPQPFTPLFSCKNLSGFRLRFHVVKLSLFLISFCTNALCIILLPTKSSSPSIFFCFFFSFPWSWNRSHPLYVLDVHEPSDFLTSHLRSKGRTNERINERTRAERTRCLLLQTN